MYYIRPTYKAVSNKNIYHIRSIKGDSKRSIGGGGGHTRGGGTPSSSFMESSPCLRSVWDIS